MTVAEQLAGRRAALEADLAALRGEVPTGGDQIPFGKRAGDHTAHAVSVAAAVESAGELERMLADVDRAEAKVADGTYGICDGCGGPVGDARLAEVPWASTCVACRAVRRR